MIALLEMVRLEQPLWQSILRASLTFVVLFVLMRIVPKRTLGDLSLSDLLVLIVIGDLGAAAMMGESASMGDLLAMVAVVLFWGWLIDLLEVRVPAFGRLMRHRTSVLVENGKLNRRNMRREMVTEEELMSVPRKDGIGSLDDVQAAVIESDGEISLLTRKAAPKTRGGRPFDEIDP